MTISVVDPRFRITLPKDIREDLDINAGDRITFLKKGEGILLFKVPKDPLSAMKGSLRIEGDPRKFWRKLKEEDIRDEEKEGWT
ncbi:MAG: AbrB/MazE/SpoVT family DNA-binding domain-containing protein [Thermoplasmatota archaeon]